MQLPESPPHLRDLDLMKLLAAYEKGEATWHEDRRKLGPRERAACQQLDANLTNFIETCCIADTRLVAAALRLADILDFDRERTPAVLFHYLLPQSDDPRENISVREWAKHLAISNWQIESERIVFRGRSPSAFIHHVIVEFCHTIEDEVGRTKSIYADDEWPFLLRPNVVPAIEAMGYRYMPYRFTLDEQRVYDLLMGNNLYRSRLDAVRELIQNAVDACKLRDNLMQSYDQTMTPAKAGRIKVVYEDPIKDGQAGRLTARSGIRQIQFEGAEIELLMRLSVAVGDLKVRRYGVSHTVRDLIAGRGQHPDTADIPS
jgi:hypothetical protein